MPTPTRWLYASQAILPDGSSSPCAIALTGQLIQEVIPNPTHLDTLPNLERLPDHILLSPAFINAHTHLPMACFRGLHVEAATQKNLVEDLFYHVESQLSAQDIAAFTIMGAYESILHGVALVWEHYYHGLTQAQAIQHTGLCAVIAPTLQDLGGPGTHLLDQQLQDTLTLASEHWRDKGIWAALGPHATDTVSLPLWQTILDLSRANNLPLHTHVAQSLEEVERAHQRHGCSPVALLERVGALHEDIPHHLLIHMIFASRQDLLTLSPQRHTLGLCPASQLVFAFIADAPTWQELNLPFFVATDAAASNDTMNPQHELRLVAGMRTLPTSSSSPYQDFMRSGSLSHARDTQHHRSQHHAARASLADDLSLLNRLWSIPGAMHPAFKAGQLATGHLANLIAWDTSHPNLWPPNRPLRALAMSDPSPAIHNVMSNGAWLGTHGDYHRSITQSHAYQDAAREATSRFQALRRRAGL